ncbi:MAG TPA: SdpI family protein, partial [Pyrinomonadaceae bacterium]|nr:SdpI family protein [Pyrinomonadaceae bacterium]
MEDLILLTLFFIVDGGLLIALGIPLLQGQVSPNSWYGFRTRKSLSDEKIWYAVNRSAGKDMILAGVLIIVSSIVLLMFGGRVSF